MPKKKIPPDKNLLETKERNSYKTESESVNLDDGKIDSMAMIQSTKLKQALTVGKKPTILESTLPKISKESDTLKKKDNAPDIIHDDARLPFNDTEANAKLLDRPPNKDTLLSNVPFPPSPTNPPLSAPSVPNPFESKLDLANTIKSMLQEPKSTLCDPELRFDITPEAAASNLELLKQHEFDLKALCNNGTRKSATTFGSEFKEISILQKLFKKHPRWPRFKKQLTEGVDFYLEELDEEIRRKDTKEAYSRGNHKSADRNNEFLTKALKKEIVKGWNMILPGDYYDDVPELVLNPMGVATHLGVTETGNFAEKNRVTHDLSFPGKISKKSVNSRVKFDQLEPCMFSFVFSRIVHYIVALRRKYPTTKIWIRKEDIKSAFRRLHLNAATAFRSAVRVNLEGTWYIIISLRMPFGGAPCPSEFALAADLIADTINDLLADNNWNHKEVYSEMIHKIPNPIPLPEDIPYAQAKDLSVNISVEECGKTDVYVDDFITIGPDKDDILERITKAPITVIHAIADNSINSQSIPKDDIVAEDKMKAEGAAEERKICLGWMLDTRRLKVSLPDHKTIGWKSQIDQILTQKTVSEKDLSSVLGRLENVAQVLTILGHFLSNIRHMEILAARKRHNIRLGTRAKNDLQLAKNFLDKVNIGVSMNLLTFRKPDIVYICDASEYGLGGFASHGRAWTYTIPNHLRNRAHINILEYLTQIVSLWIDIIEGTVNKEDCVLAIGDNTSAMGWLRRSNFRQKDDSDISWDVKQQLSRHLANLTLNADICLYKQWLKGADNQVADSLSRDAYYMNTNTHKNFLNLVIPQQLPPNFKIKPIPNEVSCFITSILQQLPVTQQQSSIQKPSDLARGNIGTLSYIASELHQSSWMECQDIRKILSCQDLPKPLEKAPSLREIIQTWWKEQSQPPSHMWHRPSGQTTGMTPDWTMMEKLAISCKNSTEDTATRTKHKRNRRHFQ